MDSLWKLGGLSCFFFNDPATTEIYTLSLHDALPISHCRRRRRRRWRSSCLIRAGRRRDRKSTRLNSSHSSISYAVFCLKKKNKYGFLNYLPIKLSVELAFRC